MGSSRLPEKVLADIEGKPMLGHIIDRLELAKHIDAIVVATTKNEIDDKIVNYAKQRKILFFRGPDDILKRFIGAGQKFGATNIIRICADNPFICWANLDFMIEKHEESNADLTFTYKMPVGTGLGNCVIRLRALMEVDKIVKGKLREDIDDYIIDRPNKFKITKLLPRDKNYEKPHIRLTVDTQEDLERVRRIYRSVYKNKPIILNEVINYVETNEM